MKSEYEHQVSIFTWAMNNVDKWPELYLLEGSANGIRLNMGQIKKAKKSGCFKKGMPDIHLPVPRGGYASWFCELKTETGKASEEQEQYLLALQNFGNYACICKGDRAAIKSLSQYLKGRLKNDR